MILDHHFVNTWQNISGWIGGFFQALVTTSFPLAIFPHVFFVFEVFFDVLSESLEAWHTVYITVDDTCDLRTCFSAVIIGNDAEQFVKHILACFRNFVEQFEIGRGGV